MRAHTPPFTKPEAAYDSRRLYEETSAIAAAQDAKHDPGNDALPSILADFRAVVKRLEAYAKRLRVSRTESAPYGTTRWFAEQGLPAESAYLVKHGSRIVTAAEVGGLRHTLTPEQCAAYGIGDVAETATTVATSQHPANAEALRMADERTPEDRL